MIHVKASKEMISYFESIQREVKRIYEIAEKCRKKGYDPVDHVEIPLARDMADRVEGLVGPEGVANRIRELVNKYGKERAALEIAREIVEGKFGKEDSKEKLAEQAIRTALAILTEGIVAAPLEGIAHVKIKKNKDGSEYLAIYFAGPIRSAGGTAQALAVLVGDYVRKALGLSRYIPTEEEIERYVEEVDLYQSEVGTFQYSPSAEEIRTAVKNIPIEITGEATDDVEVSGHRDLERVETNQLRGGALLVLVEGVLLKAPKILRHVDKLGIEGWEWLKKLKGKKEEKEEKEDEKKRVVDPRERLYEDVEIEPITKYIGEVIAGRPVFAHPSRSGGFRLRYGRSRNTGFATDGLHPALMYLLDEFIAVGTQLKTERPGKATCAAPVDSIEGPIVKLRKGDVLQINTVEEAIKYRDQVKEILFLGDILINYGDFLENNHPILPSSWCEEWYEKILASRDIEYTEDFIKNPDHKEAVKFAIETKTPLHPRFTYYWHEVSKEDILLLRDFLLKGSVKIRDFKDVWVVPYEERGKRLLELIGCCHRVVREGGERYIEIEDYYPLLYSLGYEVESKRDLVEDIQDLVERAKNSMHLVNLLAPFEIRRKAYVYIGARMGRPEKAAPRKMKPPVNSLFPIGNAGGNVRLINKAVEEGKRDVVEVSYGECPNCGRISLYRKCPFCDTPVELSGPRRIEIPLEEYWRRALRYLGLNKVGNVKCIKGMTSKRKIVEPLEKGILRAINNVYVFKDGTLRFDCTDVPLTHFKPCEINVSVEKLRELGYEKDIYGNPLEREDQIVELKVQDIIIPKACAEYFVNAAKFIDDLLERFYKVERFYNVKSKEDLIGHLVVGMAPHTSAGMVGRIIGYCDANVGYAHPYFHASKRRNCFPGDTKILVNIDGEVKRITLEELFNLYDGEKEYYENQAYIRRSLKDNIKVQVYSFDREKREVVLTDIEEVLKIPSPNHLLSINLQDGRSFKTTPDHPVIVYDRERDEFIEKRAMEVKEGDLLLIPKLDNFGEEIPEALKDRDLDYLMKLLAHFLGSESQEEKDKDRLPSFVYRLPRENVKTFISTYLEVAGERNNGGILLKGSRELLEDIDTLLNSKFNILGSFNGEGLLLKEEDVKKIQGNEKEDNFGWLLEVKDIEILRHEGYVYSLKAKKYHNVIVDFNILTHQCDGDEDSIFLLLDAFLNFSKVYLPEKRGGQMDAPLVLTTILDPKEVDGEVHNMDVVWEYPLEFYERSLEMPSPKDVKDLIETVEDRLGTPAQYEGLGYTHETSRIDRGPLVCSYKTLDTMLEKTEAQLTVARKIRAADERDVAEKVIQSHFIPDLIGNLRAFSRQGFRCKCGAKYRRVPLRGVCPKCGSKLILTVSRGAVEKYMDVSQKMAEEYNVNNYIKQRLELIRDAIDSLFKNEKVGQSTIGHFLKNR
ncbi:MAG TPA: DNA-directed DNA polymerase II large subunit [Methanothermococcus okinawensis]|uniref:DNA polymerase II large subunit n=1 Tax=Methanothermococcus okinawensis TaxID=155863 RepID=A0A832ZYW6_9EURY|nr:DNA-directed DNA polymerase II large subunit [Methanothermococcus okinawensis]